MTDQFSGGHRGVNLAPSSMTDSVADWSLSRVIDHLRNREDKEHRYVDTHVTSRIAVRLLLDSIDDLALRHRVTRAQMSRWISYHALAMLQEDRLVTELYKLCGDIRRKALEDADADSLAIMSGLTAYHATNITECTVSLYLHEPWMKGEFQSKASLCGVRAFSLVQAFFMRSMLTVDSGSMTGTLEMFRYECNRWNRWVERRLDAMRKLSTGEIWGSDGPPENPVVR